MSDWIHNEPCPECRKQGRDAKGNNLGVFSDGHAWCWSCGHYVPAENASLRDVERRLQEQEQKAKNDGVIVLPYDFDYTLPPEPLAWIKKYGITDKEIEQHNFGWSERNEQLIFPVYNREHVLCMYQARTFSKNPDRPKYVTNGDRNSVFHYVVGDGVDNRGHVVVTEDLLSAIKVGRHVPAMPLWGSSCNREQALVINKTYSYLNIWLDGDKQRAAIELRAATSLYFMKTSCIITDFDPKEYSDGAICQWLAAKGIPVC